MMIRMRAISVAVVTPHQTVMLHGRHAWLKVEGQAFKVAVRTPMMELCPQDTKMFRWTLVKSGVDWTLDTILPLYVTLASSVGHF